MTMNRRALVAGLSGLALCPAIARAHTPYRQWVVYRQKHLLIGCHRGDLTTYAMAQAVVAALERDLPAAKARVARGPRPQRIASLMGTGQLLISVIARDEARRMAAADTPFEAYDPVPVEALAALDGAYGLYAIPELRQDHAWMVLDALANAGLAAPPVSGPISRHSGAEAFWAGARMPAPLPVPGPTPDQTPGPAPG